ncbi:MAG: hypothetical protein ACRDHN_19010 [Thermomicrobiales bacterium]
MRVMLSVAGAESSEQAIDALLELDEPCGTCVLSSPPTIATLASPRGWRNRSLAQLLKRLGDAHGEILIANPPTLTRGLLSRSTDWIDVNLGGRGDRLEKVTLARSIFDSEMLFAFANLDRPAQRTERTTIAIGLWSHFTRGLERIGARVGDDRTGLPAEIALGVVVRRYFVTATTRTVSLAASTTDPIVSELLGRALLRLSSDSILDETVAPWEEPLVQRASELKLGVQSADEIELASLWRGSAVHANKFATIVQDISDLLSLPVSSPVESVSIVSPT